VWLCIVVWLMHLAVTGQLQVVLTACIVCAYGPVVVVYLVEVGQSLEVGVLGRVAAVLCGVADAVVAVVGGVFVVIGASAGAEA